MTTTNNNQTGEKTMTINHNELKRLLAEFEREYSFPLSMPSPSVYETAIVRLNDEILAQAQRDGVVSRELQCERDQTDARWQMAMTFAPFVNALSSLLADLDEVIRDRNEWADSTRGANQRMRESEDRVKLLRCDLEAAEKREQVLREAVKRAVPWMNKFINDDRHIETVSPSDCLASRQMLLDALAATEVKP
jgi:hypothetical protein